MSLLLLAPVYFVAGFLSDFLVAKYFLAFMKRRRGRASFLAGVIELFGYAITATLVLTENIPGAVSLALGTSLGTWVAMGKNKQETPRCSQTPPRSQKMNIGDN